MGAHTKGLSKPIQRTFASELFEILRVKPSLGMVETRELSLECLIASQLLMMEGEATFKFSL